MSFQLFRCAHGIQTVIDSADSSAVPHRIAVYDALFVAFLNELCVPGITPMDN
jgi:hypothetical protein